MARTESILTIFLASPGDVSDERERLAEVVDQWNTASSRAFGLRLELRRWETDAYPGIGTDAQAVINRQIPDDCDIFIGIMWGRVGTPTGRAESGTIEEFERVLARFHADSSSVQVLFYFKDSPIAPSKLDPSQLAAVQRFKQRLGSQGIYFEFGDVDEFAKLAGLHLAKIVHSWREQRRETGVDGAGKSHIRPPGDKPNAADPVPSIPFAAELQATSAQRAADEGATEDAGYFELLEQFESQSAQLNEIAGRMATAQNDLAERVTGLSEQVQAITANPGFTTRGHAKKLMTLAASEMRRFTQRIEAEVPLFSAALDGSIVALTRAAALSAEFNVSETRDARQAADVLLTSLRGAKKSTLDFRQSTASFPRMTTEVGAATRMQVAALDRLLAEFSKGENLLVEAVSVMDALLAGLNGADPPSIS